VPLKGKARAPGQERGQSVTLIDGMEGEKMNTTYDLEHADEAVAACARQLAE